MKFKKKTTVHPNVTTFCSKNYNCCVHAVSRFKIQIFDSCWYEQYFLTEFLFEDIKAWRVKSPQQNIIGNQELFKLEGGEQLWKRMRDYMQTCQRTSHLKVPKEWKDSFSKSFRKSEARREIHNQLESLIWLSSGSVSFGSVVFDYYWKAYSINKASILLKGHNDEKQKNLKNQGFFQWTKLTFTLKKKWIHIFCHLLWPFRRTLKHSMWHLKKHLAHVSCPPEKTNFAIIRFHVRCKGSSDTRWFEDFTLSLPTLDPFMLKYRQGTSWENRRSLHWVQKVKTQNYSNSRRTVSNWMSFSHIFPYEDTLGAQFFPQFKV